MEPYIYSIISKENLQEMLVSFEACLNLPIQFIDNEGESITSEGKCTTYCKAFQKHLPHQNTCDKLHASASKKAIALGESYIFSCHGQLNHIVYPLIHKNVYVGSILVGPFHLEPVTTNSFIDVSKRHPIPASDLIDLYEKSGTIPVCDDAKIKHINRLLYYLFLNLMNPMDITKEPNKEKLYNQMKTKQALAIHQFHASHTQETYPYEKEKELITKVKTKNIEEAKDILNDLLGYVLACDGNNIDIMKARSIELCSLLSRATIEGGAPTDHILKINNSFIKMLQSIESIDELCSKLQETIDTFMEDMFHHIPSKNSELIKKAIRYISKNYANHITLEETANYVHLNPAYFSTIFKQSCGSSFKEYLNLVRIEESKHLLSNTDYSIVEIATATGFEDQSYFSKVFKKYTGITPRQYR